MLDCTECTVMDRAKLLNAFQWREFKGTMPEGYDWVLVCDKKGNKPIIAEYSNISGKWHADGAFNSNLEDWYEVKYWKPIYDEAVPCCGLSEAEWKQFRKINMNEHIQIAECYADQIKSLLDLMQTSNGADIESINVAAEMCLNMFCELMDEVEKMKPEEEQ